jgi:predicted O-methyltransferase YrrM
MTTLDPIASTPAAAPSLLRVAPALFATTLFLSALLLFLVQPMFTKMVLPRLGGAPAVWSVAMVFFQAALLAGYAYAHLLVRRLPLWLGALVHLGILALAALTLPIGIAQGFGAPPTTGIALWLMALFAASIGLPFAVLSASAPLMQGWFAASGHPQAGNPYVLYAASNLGSFAALVAYPIVIEPILTLKQQAQVWSVGFAVLALLIAAASLLAAHRPSIAAADTDAAPTSVHDRLAWLALAAIPSGLVIAVTSYITTDVAAAPFLWVVPLALYLATFVAVFRERPWLSQATVARLVPILVAPLSIGLLGGDRLFWLAMIIVNLAAFVLLALLCHGELYRRRPAPARLTEFYLWVSLGGVLGGIFAALIAPHVFNRIYEYPILLLAALLVLRGMFAGGPRRLLREAGPVLAIAVLAVAVKLALGIHLPAAAELPFQVALVALAAVMLLQRQRPARFFALAALAFVVTGLWQPGFDRLETRRSFFGVHQVSTTADGCYRLLYHGTTLHGAERIRAAGDAAPPEPLTYYYFGGPISEGIAAVRGARGSLRNVAVVGLGAGSLACHRHADERWTFFEIDPDVAQIARDPRHFSFIGACAPDLAVVLGDARLTLAASQERYDLIVLDAFSSDAIPVHLLTREAVAGYLDRLAPNGALILHISNRHMELGRVVAAVAAAEGLVSYLKEDNRPEVIPTDFKMNALVAALARKSTDLGELPSRPGWHEIKSDPRDAAWTDDYSDIFGAIVRKKLGR